MNGQSPQAYLYLIQELLRCSKLVRIQVLRDNTALVDAQLLQLARQMQSAYAARGDDTTAQSLNELAEMILKEIEPALGKTAPPTPTQFNQEHDKRPKPSSGVDVDEEAFIAEFLPLILQNGADLSKLFPAMLKKLDPESGRQMREALKGSGRDPKSLINSLAQSGFLGNPDSELVKIMETLAGQVSKKDSANSPEESLVSGIGDLLEILEQKGKSDEVAPLKSQVDRVANRMGVPSPYKGAKSLVVSSQIELLLVALDEIVENKNDGGSHEQIYERLFPLLQTNEDKLNNSFPDVIRTWGEALPQGTPENSRNVAAGIFLFGEAVVKFQLGSIRDNIEIAIACYEASLMFFDKKTNALHWAISKSSLGNAYIERLEGNKSENVERAIAENQIALQVYPMPEARKEWIETQKSLSSAYRRRLCGNPSINMEMAVAAAEAALEMSDEIAFPKEWAGLQQTLASAYDARINGDRQINIERAIDANNKALTVYTPEKHPEQWAAVNNNLAHVYRHRSFGSQSQNIELAIKAANAAVTVQIREKAPADWAVVQTTLGSTYLMRIEGDHIDNLKQAISAYQCALEVYTAEAMPESWAMAQTNLATIYFTCAEQYKQHSEQQYIDLAISSCKAALNVYTRERFKERWIQTYTTLANAYSMKKSGNSQEYTELAVEIYSEVLEASPKSVFPFHWALVQLNLANAQRSLGSEPRLRASVLACQKALEVYTRSAFPSRWAMAQNNLGSTYRALGDTAAAVQSYCNALEVHTPETDPENCLKHGYNLGKTALNSKQWDIAIEGFRFAIDAVEKKRGWATFDTRKQAIISEAIGAYFGIVESYLKKGQPHKALEYVERSKGQNLVDLLGDRDHEPKGNVPAKVNQRLKQLNKQIVGELRRLEVLEDSSQLILQATDNQQVLSRPSNNSSRDYLSQLQQQLEKLITDEIDPIDPTFRSTQQVQSISFAEIRSLMDERTTILEWYVTSTGFYTFAINAQWDSPKVWSSENFDHDNFKRLIAVFNNYLQTYQSDRGRWRDSLPVELLQLVEILCMEDILDELPAECDRLILIPHRFLHLLPLHALPIQNGDLPTQSYLLDRFPSGISYAPSCQFLHLSQASERPDFDRLIALQNPKTQQENLPYTDLSTRTLKTLFDSEETRIFESAEATKENLYTASLSSCHCLHFGCHGYFNTTSTRESALILANTSKLEEKATEKFIKIDETHTVNIDHCLTLDDIFNLDLSQCRLVMLSACETGLIEFQNISDEYIGLPSGFMYAGSTNVVSSLWRVNEVSTLLLVTKFYLELQNQKPIRVALNQAQRWLRDATGEQIMQWIEKQEIPIDEALLVRLERRVHQIQYPFRSPYYWGAFCAAGQ